jgi:hypothetical protein
MPAEAIGSKFELYGSNSGSGWFEYRTFETKSTVTQRARNIFNFVENLVSLNCNFIVLKQRNKIYFYHLSVKHVIFCEYLKSFTGCTGGFQKVFHFCPARFTEFFVNHLCNPCIKLRETNKNSISEATWKGGRESSKSEPPVTNQKFYKLVKRIINQ